MYDIVYYVRLCCIIGKAFIRRKKYEQGDV